MKIAVLSCDKNTDIFEAFHHCMEKYWRNHPEIIYFTESVKNPYYKTVSVPHDIHTWTRGAREFLRRIDDDQILLMVDDIFIRREVDVPRILYASEHLEGNIALFNFEKTFDPQDEPTNLIGWKKRKHGSEYEVSLMCGMWNKGKLIDVLGRDCTPWTIELVQEPCGYDYYINAGDYIIDWGYKTFRPCGLVKGKWAREIIPFFEKEGIQMDYSRRGFCE